MRCNRGDDHRVVEQPAQTLLVGDVAIHVERERIAVREHAPEREKDARHPDSRVSENAAQGSESPERQMRRPHECVGVEHANERDVHEEALGLALFLGKILVHQVGAHDARVVSAVPVAPCRPRDELQPELYRPRRWLAAKVTDQRHGLASVA